MADYVVTAKGPGGVEGPRSTIKTIADFGYTTVTWDAVAGATGYRLYRRWDAGTPVGNYDEYWDTTSNGWTTISFPTIDGFANGGTVVTQQPPAEGASLLLDATAIIIDGGEGNNNYFLTDVVLDKVYAQLQFGDYDGAGVTGSIYMNNNNLYLNSPSGKVQTSGQLMVGTSQIHSSNKMSVGGAVSIGANYDDDDASSNGLLVEGNVCIGYHVPQSQPLYVAGDARFTGTMWSEKIKVGDTDSDPPIEGAWIEGPVRIGQDGDEYFGTYSDGYLQVYNKIGINSAGSTGGLEIHHWYHTNDKAQIQMTTNMFSSGVSNPSYANACMFVMDSSECNFTTIPYYYYRFKTDSEEWTALRLWAHGGAENEASNLVMCGSKPSHGYRWTKEGEGSLFNNYTTTYPTSETFMVSPIGGQITKFYPGSVLRMCDYAGGVELATLVGQYEYFFVPLKIPQGGVITGYNIKTWKDTGASAITVELYRQKTSDSATYSYRESSAAGSWVYDGHLLLQKSGLNITVYEGYSYMLRILAPGNCESLKIGAIEIIMDIDRHFPRWMG